MGLGSNTQLYVRGYPGDKGGSTMWWTSGPLSSRSTSRRLYSNVYDTTGVRGFLFLTLFHCPISLKFQGSSGSGVYSYWVPSGETRTARVVHATHSGWNNVCVSSFLGICFNYDPFNRATRITPSNFPLYCSWTGLC
jgi:V8-like Glu-specific endopeptidase